MSHSKRSKRYFAESLELSQQNSGSERIIVRWKRKFICSSVFLAFYTWQFCFGTDDQYHAFDAMRHAGTWTNANQGQECPQDPYCPLHMCFGVFTPSRRALPVNQVAMFPASKRETPMCVWQPCVVCHFPRKRTLVSCRTWKSPRWMTSPRKSVGWPSDRHTTLCLFVSLNIANGQWISRQNWKQCPNEK